jgi:hypothetical protein
METLGFWARNIEPAFFIPCPSRKRFSLHPSRKTLVILQHLRLSSVEHCLPGYFSARGFPIFFGSGESFLFEHQFVVLAGLIGHPATNTDRYSVAISPLTYDAIAANHAIRDGVTQRILLQNS